MSNSFIRTASGLSIVANNKPYTVDRSHPNYDEVVNALREKQYDAIKELVDIKVIIQQYVAAEATLDINLETGVVTFQGQPVQGVIVNHILDMVRDNFDIAPMTHFLRNVASNPSAEAVEQLYGWMEKNGITITEDGHMLAYKRVRDDFKSFYDGRTDNQVGTFVQMPRANVDSNRHTTCSTGLHFCSQAYLPQYCSGLGRVLLLKINPADVVAVPTDYNNAKGRACKYLVLDELKADAREDVEVKSVIAQPVVADSVNVSASNVAKRGYEDGYKDGRGKKAIGTSFNEGFRTDSEYTDAYNNGRQDGRAKKPKLYYSTAPQGNSDPIAVRVINAIKEQLGYGSEEVLTLTTTFHGDLQTDSLDDVELIMAIEDEFAIEVSDEDTESLVTIGDVVTYVSKRLNK